MRSGQTSSWSEKVSPLSHYLQKYMQPSLAKSLGMRCAGPGLGNAHAYLILYHNCCSFCRRQIQPWWVRAGVVKTEAPLGNESIYLWHQHSWLRSRTTSVHQGRVSVYLHASGALSQVWHVICSRNSDTWRGNLSKVHMWRNCALAAPTVSRNIMINSF